MPVTEHQAAALRAQLSGDIDEASRLIRQFSTREDLQGFAMLTMAVFIKAVRLRYGRNGTREDAIRLVADVRSRSDRLSESIDPGAAESVLTAAFTHSDVPELDPEELRGIFNTFGSVMITEAHLDGAQLDDFLAKARALADKMLSQNVQPQQT
jgi:hypothetical protein